MTKPDNKSKPTPADRLHAIMSGVKNEESPVSRLPKAKPAEGKLVSEAIPLQSPSPTAPKAESAKRGFQFLPAFWTIASIISLAVNIILLAVLIGALHGLDVSGFGQMGTGLVGGLYSNFEKMDAAHIKTTIPVQSNIPLSMSIPVQTTTNISLATAVEIPNAHVKISTGTFNIDSDADVTLPAGTNLSVVLNFNVPVQTTVPVNLSVPVDIALNKTELDPAITGLESTIKPLYCMLNPGAISINNVPVCR
ncbi:MAG: hypothetical protein WCA79_02005 [Anaerolineales bacterium]